MPDVFIDHGRLSHRRRGTTLTAECCGLEKAPYFKKESKMFYKFESNTPSDQRKWLVEKTNIAAMRPWDSGGGIDVLRYDFEDGAYCLLTAEGESEDLNSLRKKAVYGKYRQDGTQEFTFDVDLIRGVYSFDTLAEAAQKAAAYRYLAGWWQAAACGDLVDPQTIVAGDLDWAMYCLGGSDLLFTDDGTVVDEEEFSQHLNNQEEWTCGDESKSAVPADSRLFAELKRL